MTGTPVLLLRNSNGGFMLSNQTGPVQDLRPPCMRRDGSVMVNSNIRCEGFSPTVWIIQLIDVEAVL